MAHKKASGSTRLGRDSESKRLGIKKYGGQLVISGNIIVRQRGTKFTADRQGTTRRGNDDTIYAVKAGKVLFKTKRKMNFDGRRKEIKIVSVV